MKSMIPLLLGASLLVAACSGGSGGSIGAATVAAFNDGAALRRAEINGPNGRLVGTALASGGAGGLVTSAGFDFGDLREVERLGLQGRLVEGVLMVNGRPMDVLAYQDSARIVRWVELSDNNRILVFTGGAPMSGSYPTGTFTTYQGANFIGRYDGSDFDWGSFTLTVDFANGTGTLNGSTSDFINSRISGPVAIDRNSGTLSGNQLNLTVDGQSYTARIDGNFHGSAARGVTGQYRDTGQTPTVTGSIAGTR